MRVYVIEHSAYIWTMGRWESHLSQEGYRTLEEAQKFIESRYGSPKQTSPMTYTVDTEDQKEEYKIHDILIQ